MKISKKLVSIILCVVLLGTIAITGVANENGVPALDKTGPYIDFLSEPVKAGETATVTAVIGNNPGVWGIKMTFDFGETLSPVIASTTADGDFPKVDYGADFKNMNGVGDNNGYDTVLISPIDGTKFTYLYTNSQSVQNSKNGNLVTFYFNVPANAKSGEYNIDIVDYSADNFIDANKKVVDFTFGQPVVTVVDNTPVIPSEPSQSESEPSQSESEPSQSESEPSQSESEPSQSESEPSQSESEPSQSESEPSQSESEPSQSESEPSQSESEPSQSESEPTSSSSISTDPAVDDPFSPSSNTGASGGLVVPPTPSVSLKAPVATAVVTGKTTVKISWKAVANAKSYQVYRAKNNSNSYVLVKTLTGVSYTDKTVKGAAKYKYKVRAIDGDVKADSTVKTVSLMNFKAKATFKVAPNKKAVKVTMKRKLKYASGYQISYSTNSKFKKKLTKTTTIKATKNNKTIKKLKAAKKYYVRIRGYQVIKGKKQYGAWSKVAKATTKR